MTENLLDDKDDSPKIDPNKNYLEDLVGDGKKFKSPEELARGKFQADQYIEILEKRLDESRNEYLKVRDENVSRAKLEDVIAQLEQKLMSTEEPKGKEEPAQFDPTKIESLVTTKIQEHETTRTQTNNFNLVRNKLKERYGDNYKTTLSKQIEELEITETELNDMARRQPKALLRTLGLDKEPEVERFQTPPRSQRSDNFKPRGTEKRTWTYYQNLKKTNPQAWFDPKTAVQMQQDAIDLGDAFKDGDFNVYGQ